MTGEEYLAEVQRIHDEWVATAEFTLDEKWAGRTPSSYTEGIADVSATPESDKRYRDAINALTARYRESQGRPATPPQAKYNPFRDRG